MKLFLPKQHGAWAMLIIPFWLGVVASGFLWQHIPFFFGWMLLYLATYPTLLLFKKKKIPYYTKWALIYFIPALILLLIPLWIRPSIIYFGLAMIPLFVMNAYYSSKKNDRALLNDISAIFSFSIVGLASGYLATGEINSATLIIFIASVLFFIGTTFHVKTIIRERKNIMYKRISWTYHILVPVLWAALGYWVISLAFLPALIRALYYYGKPLKMKKSGIIEVVNAALFFIMMIIAII
ncbi:YwiC-like family protein [Virgibacillus sp. NKC19-3]|uniref:YwiC-like family protein n=1 Tax=Virgibacillus saliphilus TaxID=2831674 RepID=UPI001C9AF75F|nr:YwiC-like family protein [Virgibacillus sp. NKC19-3]MBY7142057.1 YwiC-like family protein [Virgibacillus sp. NKC19-3]